MWYQRCAVWRLTPNRSTIVACDAPRPNKRAASNRRASSAAISCFLAMPQHGIVAHDPHHFIARGSLDNLAEGVSAQELLDAYPQLTADDIRAAIAYGAEMARERFVDIPTERPA